MLMLKRKLIREKNPRRSGDFNQPKLTPIIVQDPTIHGQP